MPAKRIPLTELTGIELLSEQPTPLFRQLYLALRERMLSGRLLPGTKLPSSRALAGQLNLGRNTVITAYEQLLAEGYLDSRSGSGTFVAIELPDNWHSSEPMNVEVVTATPDIPLSEYANKMAAQIMRRHGNSHSFAVGVPDLRAFPAKLWNRLVQQTPAAGLTGLMGFCDPAGHVELREAIADYVRSARAVKCDASQVVITTGAQQSLDLAIRLLVNPGEQMVIEEPGYIGARRALMAAGAQVVPCPVDDEGLRPDVLKSLPESPRLAYVTPANQYPLGSVLSLQRRAELVQWAQENNSWIIEDDYDSEYHYRSRPLASLQGLAPHQVIYIGSFSKVLFPALRLGYLILPPSLVDVFTKARMEHTGDIAIHPQAVTAAFMQEGHFSRHLKKMRQSYSEKLSVMLEESEALKPWCKTHDNGAGMHFVLELLPSAPQETLLSTAMLEQGILHSPLSSYFIGCDKRHGVVLGFANSNLGEIRQHMATLREILMRLTALGNKTTDVLTARDKN